MLTDARDLLNSAQSTLAATLDDRQTALETLASGLVKKSEEIERVMRSFEGVVGKALEGAEGRTKTSTEQMRTAISEVVESATKRFADATDEIRKTAGTIRTELDQTRAELKKGVMQLPEETKESTSAMRKAVSEQIKALKELSEIVSKSGRTFDVSPARIERQAAPAPRPAAPVAAPQAATQLRGSLADPAPQGQAGGSWVGALLRGASKDEAGAPKAVQPQRSPLQMVESLNSLSVDIARAIDHEASVELWDRYRKGERNVFTRRLYTLKGQQTFDDIRRKYQNDGEFRGAVDRYCQDFEKLLADVAKNDRDNMMSQTYLTSDTGKVYTMLAHASGRLK